MTALERFTALTKQVTGNDHGHHLSLCECGVPSWCQPCPTCGFYPMGHDRREEKRVADLVASRGGPEVMVSDWLEGVSRVGVGTWWARNHFTRTVAWRDDPVWRIEAAQKMEMAAALDWPTAQEILAELGVAHVQ